MQKLTLSGNQLSSLPASISQLSNLQSLFLKNNQLSTFDLLSVQQLKTQFKFNLYSDSLPHAGPPEAARREELSQRLALGDFELLDTDQSLSPTQHCYLTQKPFSQITRPVVFAGQLYELSALMDHWLETGTSPANSGIQLPLENFFTGADRLKKAIAAPQSTPINPPASTPSRLWGMVESVASTAAAVMPVNLFAASAPEPEYLVASLQDAPSVQAQPINADATSHLPMATAVVVTPALSSDAAVQAILQGLLLLR